MTYDFYSTLLKIHIQKLEFLSYQKNQNKVQAKEMLGIAWKTLTASTDWKYEKSCSETGDVIASRQSEEGRKIFKLTVSFILPSNKNFFLYAFLFNFVL